MFLTSILGQCVRGYSGQSIRNLLVIISVGWRLWLVSDVFDHLVEFSLGLVNFIETKGGPTSQFAVSLCMYFSCLLALFLWQNSVEWICPHVVLFELS